MKIVTKTIANWIKSYLPSLINETQSTFVPERLIIDNVLIAHEAFHYLKKKKHGRKGYMAIKLDFSKAYDRVDWRFLYKVLTKMTFMTSIVNLIMKCVTFVSYSIIVNGEPRYYFKPTKD